MAGVGRACFRLIAFGLALPAAGCAFVPQSRLAECHSRSQGLQAETSRLKDEALTLRNQNRDLVQRGIEDARRVHELEAANGRAEQTLAAYRQEREAMVESFEQIKREVQVASDLPPTAMLDRFHNFARAHPGCRYDADRSLWLIPSDLLFEPGKDALSSRGALLLKALARVLADPEGPSSATRVVAAAGGDDVKLASFKADAAGPALAGRRAKSVRAAMAAELGVDPGGIEALEGLPSSAPPAIEIEVRRRPPGPAPRSGP